MCARSSDPYDAPMIQPNYLAAETDQRALEEGVRWCRRFLGTSALRPYFESEVLPSVGIERDDEVLDYARSTGSTVSHAVSTCRMGNDPIAVVDDQLRVRGLEGLRVIDASVMPTMLSANTNAATMMIAKKGADLLKAAAA
jgi:choline dehydrogenase